MKKTGFLIGMLIMLCCCMVAVNCQGQFALEAVSGSLSHYGSSQYIAIDSNGQLAIYEADIQTGPVDSAFTTLSGAQLSELIDTINAVGFFGLDTLYDNGTIDGSGIVIGIRNGSQEHVVDVRNFCQASINSISLTINSMLAANGVALRLSYNYLNADCSTF